MEIGKPVAQPYDSTIIKASAMQAAVEANSYDVLTLNDTVGGTTTLVCADGNLEVGGVALATTSDVAARQPLDSDLTAIAALTTTAYGRNLLTLANQAALQAAVGATGGGTWGSITGTLSSQTDLQTAINGKLGASVTKAELNTAVSDGNVVFEGDTITVGTSPNQTEVSHDGTYAIIYNKKYTTSDAGRMRLGNNSVLFGAQNTAVGARFSWSASVNLVTCSMGSDTSPQRANFYAGSLASDGVLNLYGGSGQISFWNSGTTSVDAQLLREASDTLIQRRGTTSQELRVANTWTSTTNFEVWACDWKTTANRCIVGPKKGSSGTLRQQVFTGISSSASDPSATEFADGQYGLHKNTTSGAVFWVYNDGGTIKKVQMT